MNTYTLSDLQNPATYQNDAELSTLARKFGGEAFNAHGMTRDQFTTAILAGQFAPVLYKRLEKLYAAEAEARAEEEKTARKRFTLIQKLSALSLPDGFAAEYYDEKRFAVKCPYSPANVTALKSLGGKWSADEKSWLLSYSKAGNLPQALELASEINAKNEADRKADRQSEANKRQSEREAQWARERAAQKAEEERIRRAKSTRVKVAADDFKIGDEIDGKIITSFGEVWMEIEPSSEWCKSGQRWDEGCDSCGHVGVVDNHTSLCSKCFGGSKTERTCYAYFE